MGSLATPASPLFTTGASLLAAITWGAGDFSGGFATRRASPFQVIALSHGADVLLLGIWLAFTHAGGPTQPALIWGTLSGLINGFALAAFYLALSEGQMGLAAALGGVLTAVVPVAAGAFFQGLPSLIHFAGFIVALLAIYLLTRPSEHGTSSRRAVWLACGAGLGFGIFLVLSRFASQTELVWPLLASRAGSTFVALVAMLSMSTHRISFKQLHGETLKLAMAAGVLDALGNLAFMWSARAGRLDAAAVLASLYPAVTILFAVIFLRERFTKTQLAGLAMSLLAVMLVSRP